MLEIKIKEMIEKDIEMLNKVVEVRSGSQDLYKQLVAKYMGKVIEEKEFMAHEVVMGFAFGEGTMIPDGREGRDVAIL